MNNFEVTRQSLLFFVFLIVQIFFAKHLALFGVAFCFIYIHFILTSSLLINRILLLFLAFLMGFIIDNFYDTLGMHTTACVLIAYLRPYLITLLNNKNEITEISIRQAGLTWFLYYTLSLTFVHHFLLFYLQQFNLFLFWDTLLKVVASTLFTVFVIVLNQYLFFSSVNDYARK